MLDRLFGRTKRQERIETLEDKLQDCREERAALEKRYEAANRRESEAIREHQEAQERLNRAQDRIAQLEDRVEQLSGTEHELDFRGQTTLRGEHLEAVLERLENVRAPPDRALTAVLADELPEEVREAFGDCAPLLQRARPCIALTDADNLVRVALRPPILPETTVTWAETFELDRSWFRPTGTFTLALVRADLFALGEYQGTTRRSLEQFESSVGSNHSKGGFSQARFERRRDEAIDEHLTRCEQAIRDRSPDRLILAGDREALDALELDAVATVPVDATGEPEQALDEAFQDVWTTRLFRL